MRNSCLITINEKLITEFDKKQERHKAETLTKVNKNTL